MFEDCFATPWTSPVVLEDRSATPWTCTVVFDDRSATPCTSTGFVKDPSTTPSQCKVVLRGGARGDGAVAHTAFTATPTVIPSSVFKRRRYTCTLQNVLPRQVPIRVRNRFVWPLDLIADSVMRELLSTREFLGAATA